MKNFRELKVWVKAYDTALHVYRCTEGFPGRETYGLSSQLRRAALSVPCNIAEGCGRHTEAELAYFLQIAMGSASELECALQFAKDLKYLDAKAHECLARDVESVKKMLSAFILKLRRNRTASVSALTADR